MKIDFEDNSYIEISVSVTGKVQIVLSARDRKNLKNNIINSAEISQEQFIKLTENVYSQFVK